MAVERRQRAAIFSTDRLAAPWSRSARQAESICRRKYLAPRHRAAPRPATAPAVPRAAGGLWAGAHCHLAAGSAPPRGKNGKSSEGLMDRSSGVLLRRAAESVFIWLWGGGRGARRIVPGYLGLAFHERDGSLNRKGDQARRSCHRCRAMKGREIARVLISKHTALVHPECC